MLIFLNYNLQVEIGCELYSCSTTTTKSEEGRVQDGLIERGTTVQYFNILKGNRVSASFLQYFIHFLAFY